ncbi:MAG: riboflavin synthase [Flavobacteriales bacterium CG03_land_8_20_14_0_80_35_15]|nr:riboflavin synthase [Zetaproteobacteria bacterium]OIO11646.1 MAG: riboflavin synthase subunit alpha [Flavobacteriaceae bacterium CG1_02_35_72]PIV16699.1 MAG: riboflavin synthase [Flavobacteriales bacterium CG03_land_8_20_14_0_80_35_15]PIX06459.1 MAG: riboflavin synthase [Flavobacteriales bacterium CG_4_8_14_3_um_filter_35_10]PJA05018.1 MAG: riboflavin synthase [Flavobacteriales bacterium CG_4_10_14_0_2_um_filter_35_18]
MFTGIIESLGQVSALKKDKDNLNITIKTPLAKQLKVDQSLAHNGVCLTVVELVDEANYRVTAIKETLEKSNFKTIAVGDFINLERAMILGARLDGHIVQGHVDQTAWCINVADANGSFVFTFEYDASINNITIEKGSITVNGVSLTVVDSKKNSFSVAIIPYTLQHTNFKSICKGSVVNLEFDVIGKYVAKLLKG